MIEIVTTMSASADGGYCRMEVQGHARAAPKGKDLVCAAVSALVQTLAGWMKDQGGKGALETDVHMEDGRAMIAANADIWQMERMLDCFEMICFGLESLARQYPKYITYRSGTCGKESKA